jgi:CheY-like chemotaxis protein
LRAQCVFLNCVRACAVLEEAPGKFDLVFSDVIMPGISGLELAQRIASRWQNLEVVLTNGYSHVLAEERSHGFKSLTHWTVC